MKKNLTGIFLMTHFLLGAQSLVEKLDSDDISSALKMLGVEIVKYDFSKQDIEHKLIIHIEEFGDGSVLKNKSYEFGQWPNGLEKKELRIISKVTSDTASTHWIKLSHPNMETAERFDVSKEFRKIHFWKQIASGEIEYNKKIPLLFYGMGWEDVLKGRKILRFCWSEGINRDMSNPTLKKIKHMILISYELVK